MGNEDSLRGDDKGIFLNEGLMFRSIQYIFQKMLKTSNEKIDYYTNVSYIEIYNEQVLDLLNDKKTQQDMKFRFNEEDVINLQF